MQQFYKFYTKLFYIEVKINLSNFYIKLLFFNKRVLYLHIEKQ